MSTDEAEDYLDIISQPMDFQTMLGKFSEGAYRHSQDFLDDMKLVFSNAEEYNQQGSTVLSCLVKTEQAFTELLQKLLPSLNYLRRRSRKRATQAPETSEEEEEEEEATRKMQNGKANGKRSKRKRYEESESEEEEEDNGRRRSKRTSATSGRKDYREQDSDGERDTRRTRKQAGRGDADSSDEDRPNQRHSKRLKR